jgi:hypothetical protein
MTNPSDTAVSLMVLRGPVIVNQVWRSPPVPDFSWLTGSFLTHKKNKSNKNNGLQGLFHKNIGKAM